jgi:hypothetical protein
MQTSLFPDLRGPALKPEPGPLEADLMIEMKRYAASLGLPSIHVETYCGNAFNVECPVCGNKTLAHCRKTLNRAAAGLPDLLGIAWGVEVKRNANYEPSPLQAATHAALRRAGVPVMVVNPDNINEAIDFLKKRHVL